MSPVIRATGVAQRVRVGTGLRLLGFRYGASGLGLRCWASGLVLRYWGFGTGRRDWGFGARFWMRAVLTPAYSN